MVRFSSGGGTGERSILLPLSSLLPLLSFFSKIQAPGIRPSCFSHFCARKADKSRGSEGLVSADRSETAALLGTTPRSIPKSSASDFAPLSTAECYPRARARSFVSSEPGVRGIRPRPLAGASAGLPRLGRRLYCRVPVGIPT